ncbi:uncharacterized protein LOC143247103 isoform X2 [Tachypleus tridentatus]|uniref:uncharacterized protein LOC143247103 isoform X2 n=1 Tax=Tachypleus tridentatus TaxID=6853 RepID=UPI003FCFEC1B
MSNKPYEQQQLFVKENFGHSSDSILDPANREFLQKQGIDEPLNKPKKVVIGLHTYCFSHEGDLIQGAYGTTGAETPFSSNIVKWKEKQMSALDEADEDNIRSLPEKDKKNLNETLEACTSTTDAFETSWKSQDESLIVSRNNDKKLRTTKSSSFPVLGSRHRLLSRQSNIEEDESEDGKITDRIQLVRPHSSPGEEKKAVLLLSAEIVSLNGTNEPSKKPLVAQESDLSTNYVRRPESLKVDNIQNKESFELEELSTTEGENSYVIECSQQHLNVDGLSGGSCPSDSSGFAEDVPSCGSARINIDNSLEEGFGKSQKEECEEMEDESGKYCSHHLTEQVKNQSGLNLDQATSHASSGLENPDLSIGLQSNQEFVVLYQQSCADVTTQVTYSQSNPISVKCVPSLLPKSHTDITANVDISTEHCASSITESVKLQMENLTPVKLFYPYLTSTSSHSSRDFKLGTVKLNDVSDVSCQTSELGVFETSVNVGNCSSSFSSKDFKFGSVKLTDVSDVACQTSELGNFDTSLNVGTVNQLFQEPSNRELRNVQQEILHTLSMKQTLLELQNLQLALKHYRFAEQQQLASRTYKFQRLLSNMSGDQRACYQLLQDIRQDIIEEVILMEELLLSLLSALCDVETASEFQNWDNRHLSEAVNKMADLLRFQTSLQSQLERIVLIMNPSQTEHPKSVINLTSVGIISQKPDCGELGWRVETIDQPESIEHVLNKESEDVVLEQPDQSELRWRAETTDQPESIEHVLKKESEDDVCQKSKPGELGWRMETTKQWESIKLVCNKESENVVSQQPDQSELGWRVETTNQPESKEHVLNKKSEDDICQKSQQGEIGHSMETPNQPRSTKCVLNREVEDACKQPDQSELDWRAGTIDQPELIEHVLNKESECTFFKQPNMVYLDKSREKISPSKCTLDTETGSSVYQQTDPAATAQEDQLEHVFTLAEVEEEMSIEKSTHYSSTKYILNHVFSSDVTLQNVNSGMEGNDCQQQQSNSSLNSVYGNVVVEQPRVENIFQICTSDCFNNVTHGINCDEQQEFEQNKQEINSGAQFKIK